MGLSKDDLAEGETIVMTLRTHPKAIFWPLVLLVLLIAAVVAVWLGTPKYPVLTWIALGVAIIVAFIWVLIPHLKWLTTQYIVTNKRLATRSGLLTKRGRDIPLYRINDISSEKSLTDRFFDCGSLFVSDASDNPPLTLHDVPHVEKVQARLQHLLFAHDDNSDEGEWPPTEPRRR